MQPTDLGLLRGDVRVKIFVGSKQTKISVELATAVQVLGPSAEYIQIAGSGLNALDFHLAYYLGRWAVEFPDAAFHIISKDTGFDPLVAHLASRKISCLRSGSFNGSQEPKPAAPQPAAARPAAPKPATVKPSKAKLLSTRLALAEAYLMHPKAGKPKTMVTLRSALKAHFGGTATEAELDGLVKKLTEKGVVQEGVGGKLSYFVG